MKLTVTEFLTLDGVSQGPGAPDEDTSGGFDRGGWFVPFVDQEFVELAAEWLAEADGLLFGRRTYDNFSRDWPKMADGDNPFAATMNSLPKYVASRSLRSADHWPPTTILSGDILAQIAELKQRPGRELQIHGSAELAQSLLAAGLVDTLRLVIAPVVIGTGRRLFPVGGAPAGLRVTGHRVTGAGLAVLSYEAAGLPEYATYNP